MFFGDRPATDRAVQLISLLLRVPLVPLLALVTVMGLAACAGDGAPAEPAEPPTAGRLFTGAVDADGRTITVDGLILTVPPGALDETVEVTIDRIPAPDVEGTTGAWFTLGPAGLVFAVPATIEFESIDSTDDIVKWVEGVREDGAAFVGLQPLPIAENDGRRRADLRSFSTVGRMISHFGGCPRRRAPPIVRTAKYDACTDELRISWSSVGAVHIEFGYRPGYAQGSSPPPVTWQNVFERPANGELVLRPPVYPGSNELAYTFVYRVYEALSCRNQTILSTPATAFVPAPSVVPPRPPEDLQVESLGAVNHIRWSLPTKPDGTIDFDTNQDGFEIQRQPPWPDGVRQTAPDVLTYEDQDADPNETYTYSVRAIWNSNSCSEPLASTWVSSMPTRPRPTPPPGPTATRVCSIIELTAQPAEQTVRVQNQQCRANGTCPDALLAFSVEQTDGRPIGRTFMSVIGPTVLAENDLILIDSPDAPWGPERAVHVFLDGSQATRMTAIVGISVPDTVFGPNGSEPVPNTIFLSIGAADCFVRTQVTVTE